MNPLAEEWLRKAEADFDLAREIVERGGIGNSDAACFHAKQAAEKHLKALLQERGDRVPRTHDLSALAGRLVPPLPALAAMTAELDQLSALGVEVRYPGFTSGPGDAATALEIARRVRSAIRSALGRN